MPNEDKLDTFMYALRCLSVGDEEEWQFDHMVADDLDDLGIREEDVVVKIMGYVHDNKMEEAVRVLALQLGMRLEPLQILSYMPAWCISFEISDMEIADIGSRQYAINAAHLCRDMMEQWIDLMDGEWVESKGE